MLKDKDEAVVGRAGTAGKHQAPASILPSTSDGLPHGTVIDRLSSIHHGRLGKLLNQLQVCLRCESRSEGGRKILKLFLAVRRLLTDRCPAMSGTTATSHPRSSANVLSPVRIGE